MSDNAKNLYLGKPHAFRTISGRLVDLAVPTADMIDIQDIAHALSQICRFGGHSPGHYSVGEHSLLVTAVTHVLLDEVGVTDMQIRLSAYLHALLHDASEAYAGDVISPLKGLLGGYKNIEHSLQRAVIAHASDGMHLLPAPTGPGIGFWASRADLLAFIHEWQVVCGRPEEDLRDTGILDEDIAWVKKNMPSVERLGSPEKVKSAFLEMYYALTDALRTDFPAEPKEATP